MAWCTNLACGETLGPVTFCTTCGERVDFAQEFAVDESLKMQCEVLLVHSTWPEFQDWTHMSISELSLARSIVSGFKKEVTVNEIIEIGVLYGEMLRTWNLPPDSEFESLRNFLEAIGEA